MIVVVPTIMHSGTHTLMFEVLRNRHPNISNPLFGPGTDNWLYHCHVDKDHIETKETRECLARLKYNLVFAPMRHPRRVAESFRREFRDTEDFLFQWAFFSEVIHNHVDCYLHIDQPIKRMEQVDKMAVITGLDLHTDFPINQDTAGCLRDTHNLELEDCPQVDTWLTDFYNETD